MGGSEGSEGSTTTSEGGEGTFTSLTFGALKNMAKKFTTQRARNKIKTLTNDFVSSLENALKEAEEAIKENPASKAAHQKTNDVQKKIFRADQKKKDRPCGGGWF